MRSLMKMKKVIPSLSVFGMSSLIATTASAQQDAGDLATNLQGQVGQMADLIGAVAFLLGALLIVMGLMKFKQHSDNPNDPSAKTSTAIVLTLVGASMIALPTVAGVGIVSLFAEGADTVDADGSLRSLGQ